MMSEDEFDIVSEDEKVKKKVIKNKGFMVVENIATETAEQIFDSDKNAVSDRELLTRIYNDIQKLKKALL